jgi:hypothetical protein
MKNAECRNKKASFNRLNEAQRGIPSAAGGKVSSFTLPPSAFAKSVLLALFGDGPGQFFDFRKVPTDFVLNDLAERNVSRAEIGVIRNQRAAHATAAGVQLTDAAGDDVDENVGRANLFQSFLAEFSVHNVFQSNFERDSLAEVGRAAI